MSEIPLFPLSAVLVPHGRMPLQIFERRYLDLVRDCMRNNSGFGVIWIRRGPEVAAGDTGEPELGDYGTYARIVDWDQLPNGLLGITIEGAERFELARHHRADSGLVMGEVEKPLFKTVMEYAGGNQSQAAEILGINCCKFDGLRCQVKSICYLTSNPMKKASFTS